MEFIGTLQKSRFWWVKVGFREDPPETLKVLGQNDRHRPSGEALSALLRHPQYILVAGSPGSQISDVLPVNR